MKNYHLTTSRLGLRNWLSSDLDPMAELCQDEEVMRFFPNKISRAEIVEYIQRMQQHFEKQGYCYFATDRLDTGEFIGFIGLAWQDYEAPVRPFTDIGWRLRRSAWGQGFATEGAKACLDFAFGKLKLQEVYAVAPVINLPSIRVMQKIGMEQVATFNHPKLLDNERLRECVFYQKKM